MTLDQVYRQQGVRIDDRHFELVLQQMLSRLPVTDPGDTALTPNELVSRAQVDNANAGVDGRAASVVPVVVGVSEAAAAAGDFIAAATAYNGVPSMAKAAARSAGVELKNIRNCAATGKITG